MYFLTETALLVCDHESGFVGMKPSQTLVRINGLRVYVEPDPVAKTIFGCPMVAPGIKQCTTTLAVSAGYSDFIRIGGQAVCLDAVTGYTDGTPPGTFKYKVRTPGQDLVNSGA